VAVRAVVNFQRAIYRRTSKGDDIRGNKSNFCVLLNWLCDSREQTANFCMFFFYRSSYDTVVKDTGWLHFLDLVFHRDHRWVQNTHWDQRSTKSEVGLVSAIAQRFAETKPWTRRSLSPKFDPLVLHGRHTLVL